MPRRLSALASAVALLSSASAWAQFEGLGESLGPYYVGASQGLTYVSNVFNSGGGETSDVISTTSLRVGIDQPISRQRVFASASVSRNAYRDNDQLDNTGYFVGTGINWETVGNLSGDVRVNLNRSLAEFNSGDAPDLRIRNEETGRDYSANVRLGVVTRLTLQAGLNRRELTYSAPEFSFREYTENGASVSARYAISGGLTVGAGLSGSKTTYPNFYDEGDPEDESERRSIDFFTDWVPSEISSVNARLSYGKTEYDRTTARDFSGVTGSLSWNWKPTGKIQLNTTFSRDDGQDVGFDRVVVDGGGTISDNSRVTNLLRLSLDYAATAKIGANVYTSYAQRELVNTQQLADGSDDPSSGRDKLFSFGVGVNWAPTRVIGVGCRASYDQRKGSTSLADEYDSHSVGCVASLTLQ